jgi:hypothetical protein
LMRPLLPILACLVCSAGEFRAGAARINLDPPLGLPMVGYGARNAQGVLDPLQARALVLSDGTRTLALVTLDLCFLFDVPEMEQIRAAVRPKGVDAFGAVAAAES